MLPEPALDQPHSFIGDEKRRHHSYVLTFYTSAFICVPYRSCFLSLSGNLNRSFSIYLIWKRKTRSQTKGIFCVAGGRFDRKSFRNSTRRNGFWCFLQSIPSCKVRTNGSNLFRFLSNSLPSSSHHGHCKLLPVNH